MDAMAALDPEVVKVASPSRASPSAAASRASPGGIAGRRMVLIAMGEAGLVTRICPARFGSCWTYAGDGVAPGQIGIERLLGEFRFRRIGAAHRALRHRSAGRSRIRCRPRCTTPRSSSSASTRHTCRCAAADVDDLLRGRCARSASPALSVTAPFKVGVMTGLASLDPDARATGAVNTLVRGGGGWRGHNTDLDGVPRGAATGSISTDSASRCLEQAEPRGRWRWRCAALRGAR